MLVAYFLYNLLFKPRLCRVDGIGPYVAGFFTGVISSAFSAGGPPTIIYTTLTGWDKNDIKATLSAFFLITGIVTAATHAVIGITTMEVLRYDALSFAAVLAGVWTGSISSGRILHKTYLKIIQCLLLVMGILVIVSTL